MPTQSLVMEVVYIIILTIMRPEGKFTSGLDCAKLIKKSWNLFQ